MPYFVRPIEVGRVEKGVFRVLYFGAGFAVFDLPARVVGDHGVSKTIFELAVFVLAGV